MEYKEGYSDLQEGALIPMADGTARPVSMVCIGDLVVDKNENVCMVVDILTGLKEVEKLNYINVVEICEVRVYSLILRKR